MDSALLEQEKPRYNEELADFVNTEFDRRRNDRKPYELQWRLNMEFLNGNQYMDIDTESMTLMDVPRAYWYQEREVYNMISTIVETRIARLARQKPIMKVRPATGEQNDLSSARVSSLLLMSTWQDENMDRKYEKFISWLEACGTCFFKTVWNKNKGRILQEDVSPKDQMQILKENRKQDENKNIQGDPFQSTQKRIILREGDIESEVCSPFELYPDNSHGDFSDTRSVIHARAYSVEDIFDWWGVRVEEEKVDVITLQSGTSGIGGLGYNVGSFRYSSQHLKKHAVLKEYYELPTIRFPYGRYIVVAGDKCLYAGVLPYNIGDDGEPDFPFTRAVSIDVVGSFWGKSVIERCIPIQRRYNALRNRKAEYLNLVTIGQWYSPEGVVEDESVLNNEPGNIITYRNIGNGVKPEPVSFPNLPQSFEMEAQQLAQEFTAVSGVSEMSRFSVLPTGARSGVALSIANEQDDTRISLTAHQLEIASIELGKKWLRMYRQFAIEPRIIRYCGSASDIDVMYWESSDLRSDDVIIDNSTALAETPSQRRQMIFDLMNTGMFNRTESNPFSAEGVRKILELLEFGYWEGGIDEDEILQEGKAKRENRQLLDGLLLNVNDFDNDEIHIREHYRFMMSMDYEELMQTPEGYALNEVFSNHVNMHKQRQDQMRQNQLQQQMQLSKKSPSESISFKDLPPSGQYSMAQQAGILVNPMELAQQQVMQEQQDQKKQEAQSKQEPPKQEPPKEKK
jgi:hypothetical protein